MLGAAAGQGAREIIIGLGGSATNDGGFGLARALGFRFIALDDRELTGPVTALLDLCAHRTARRSLAPAHYRRLRRD
jgi:glycerate kinase